MSVFAGSARGVQITSSDPLADPVTLRGTPVADLVTQAPRLVESATPLDKDQVSNAIEQVYVEQDRAATLSYKELKELQRLYRFLRAGEQDRGSVVAAWLEQFADTSGFTFQQQVWLLRQFETPEQTAVVGALKVSVLRQLTPGTVEQLTTRELASAVRALAPHLGAAEQRSLAQVFGQRWASQINSKPSFNLTDAREASALRAWQEVFELLGDYEAEPSQYIAHLPAYLAKMTATELYWRFRYEYVELLAQPIRTQDARDALFALAAEGELRQDVLRVLSSSYRQTGESDQWHRQLDELIADTSLTDDRRAQWMIAKAYSLGLTDDTHSPTPRVGEPLLHDAMSFAATDRTRLSCLRQLVLNNLAYFFVDRARADVAKYGPEIGPAGSDSIAEIERMITMVEHIVGQLDAIENSQ